MAHYVIQWVELSKFLSIIWSTVIIAPMPIIYFVSNLRFS